MTYAVATEEVIEEIVEETEEGDILVRTEAIEEDEGGEITEEVVVEADIMTEVARITKEEEEVESIPERKLEITKLRQEPNKNNRSHKMTER